MVSNRISPHIQLLEHFLVFAIPRVPSRNMIPKSEPEAIEIISEVTWGWVSAVEFPPFGKSGQYHRLNICGRMFSNVISRLRV